MTTEIVRIGDLKIDPRLMEIRSINKEFVEKYRHAYRHGANMPRLIIEAVTNRVISGNHRLTALLKEFGEDFEIEVDARTFESEKQVLETFGRENVPHGNPLSTFQTKRLANELKKEGATDEELAELFSTSISRIVKLSEETVGVVLESGEVQEKPVKHGFKPDRQLTEREYVEHVKKDRGLPLKSQASQIIRWLTEDLVEPTAKNIETVEELRNATILYLENVKAKIEEHEVE